MYYVIVILSIYHLCVSLCVFIASLLSRRKVGLEQSLWTLLPQRLPCVRTYGNCAYPVATSVLWVFTVSL